MRAGIATADQKIWRQPGYSMDKEKAAFQFPFERKLSLDGLVQFWRGLEAKEGSTRARLAKKLVAQAEMTDELKGSIDDYSVLDKHQELVSELMSAAFPFARWDDWIMGAVAPFQLEAFFATPGFERLGLNTSSSWVKNATIVGIGKLEFDDIERGKAMKAYHMILKDQYGVDAGFAFPMIFSCTAEDSGLQKYYKIHVDTRFIRCSVDGDLPELSIETIDELVRQPMDLELWQRHLPPGKFSFDGFSIVTLLDVTSNHVHSLLKNTLLQKGALTSDGSLTEIEGHLRSLIEVPDLRVGIIGITGGSFETFDSAKTIGRSLLLEDGGAPVCPHKNESVYAAVFETRSPMIVPNLESCDYCTGFEHKLRQNSVRSLIVAPLIHNERIIGILELASSEANRLSSFHRIQLMEVFSLFSSAMKRSLEDYQDRLEAVVKRQFTSIHPAVEWRFRSAAEKYLAAQAEGLPAEFEPIVFPGVYPLYGLSDIRNSSLSRNEAIQGDLLEQLGLALSIIVEASSQKPLPALDELGFRIASFASNIEDELNSETEVSAVQFLINDVEPLFSRLGTFGPTVQEKIDNYTSSIDNNIGVLYSRRRDYDVSVAMINDTIGAFLDRQNAYAQTMYPHFFEKYKTDGVDYNIYIGGSIGGRQDFDMLYLRNLRLWQLIAMCGVVWELDRIMDDLPTQLEVAHLILVQDVPISVRFRQDEKKFDVDGAYNARYEIVKKRIDKAVEKRTGIRITQPGYLSVVYAQGAEGREYRRYFDYLKAAGYIEGDPEELDVEDLQGVNGLKALRVKVSSKAPDMEVRTRPEVLKEFRDILPN